jgi:tryptophan halogenase
VADGRIARLHLSGGDAIEADLYVDAGDGDGALIAALDPDPHYAAGRGSPCDRMLSASVAPLSPLPLYSRIAAHRAGWTGLFPLANRTGVTLAYASGAMSDDEAARLLRAQARTDDIAPGGIDDRIRLHPWIGNCVAVGGAMAGGDPIDAVALHRHHIALSHLISLLPVDRGNMVEAGIFNEDVVAHLIRLRDVQAAHYRLNGRHGEPFWDDMRAAPVSADLAAKIDLFAARAMLAQHNHESFNTDSWQTLLIGHGVIPRSWDPQAGRLPDGDLIGALQAMLAKVKQKVGAMISHQAARAAA